MIQEPLPEFEVGSGNIFADIGLPNAEEHLLKARLAARLYSLITARKITHRAAAKRIGVKPRELSLILHGHFQDCSLARLMHMLTAFGQDIDIVVRPCRKAGKPGRIAVIEAAAYRLEDDPRFLRRIEQARSSIRAGRGIRLEYV